MKNFINIFCCLQIILIVVVVVGNFQIFSKKLPNNTGIKNVFRINNTENNHHYNSKNFITVNLSPFKNGLKLRGRIINEQNVRLAQFLGIRYGQKPQVCV